MMLTALTWRVIVLNIRLFATTGDNAGNNSTLCAALVECLISTLG